MNVAASARNRANNARATALTGACLRFLLLQGWPAWRQNTSGVPMIRGGKLAGMRPSSMRGAGDIVSILPGGRHLEVECKAGSGRPSVHQLAHAERVLDAGGMYVLAGSVAELAAELTAAGVRLRVSA